MTRDDKSFGNLLSHLNENANDAMEKANEATYPTIGEESEPDYAQIEADFATAALAGDKVVELLNQYGIANADNAFESKGKANVYDTNAVGYGYNVDLKNHRIASSRDSLVGDGKEMNSGNLLDVYNHLMGENIDGGVVIIFGPELGEEDVDAHIALDFEAATEGVVEGYFMTDSAVEGLSAMEQFNSIEELGKILAGLEAELLSVLTGSKTETAESKLDDLPDSAKENCVLCNKQYDVTKLNTESICRTCQKLQDDNVVKESYGNVYIKQDIELGMSQEEIVKKLRARYHWMDEEEANQIYNAVKTGEQPDWGQSQAESKVKEITADQAPKDLSNFSTDELNAAIAELGDDLGSGNAPDAEKSRDTIAAYRAELSKRNKATEAEVKEEFGEEEAAFAKDDNFASEDDFAGKEKGEFDESWVWSDRQTGTIYSFNEVNNDSTILANGKVIAKWPSDGNPEILPDGINYILDGFMSMMRENGKDTATGDVPESKVKEDLESDAFDEDEKISGEIEGLIDQLKQADSIYADWDNLARVWLKDRRLNGDALECYLSSGEIAAEDLEDLAGRLQRAATRLKKNAPSPKDETEVVKDDSGA